MLHNILQSTHTIPRGEDTINRAKEEEESFNTAKSPSSTTSITSGTHPTRAHVIPTTTTVRRYLVSVNLLLKITYCICFVAYQPAYAAPYHYQPIPPPTLPFPNVSTPSPYPVIPPVPPRHHHTSSAPAMMPSYFPQANVHMPEPAPAPAPAPVPAVYPNQPMPGGPVIPNMMQMPQASVYPGPSSSVPVMPHAATPFPEPHVNDVPDTDSSEDSIPPHDIPAAPPLAPGQYGHSRYRYERPKSMKFHYNPLPPPPKDIFERSPYVGLLKDLHRPVEETTLRRAATSPQYVNAYIVSPTGSQASREKKPRKGLFHSLSSRLGGRSKREFQPPTAQPVPIMLATTTAPPPLMFPPVIPGVGYPPIVPPPGTVFSSGSGQEPVIPGGVRSTTPQVPQAPPSPAPSHRSHRSRHSMRSRLSPQPMLKIDTHNEYASLTHLSPHRILHERKRWPTAFHLLEAFRFMDTRPDIAEQIRRCPSTDEVKAIVSQNSASSRPDWETVVIQFVSSIYVCSSSLCADRRVRWRMCCI